MVSVLPEPAPATTSSGSSVGAAMIAVCSAVGRCRRLIRSASSAGVYLGPARARLLMVGHLPALARDRARRANGAGPALRVGDRLEGGGGHGGGGAPYHRRGPLRVGRLG